MQLPLDDALMRVCHNACVQCQERASTCFFYDASKLSARDEQVRHCMVESRFTPCWHGTHPNHDSCVNVP